MPDFASALYLGLRHAHQQLQPWSALTEGRPAALLGDTPTTEIEQELALLVGTQAACLAPSTLHLFWDLFSELARRSRAESMRPLLICVDCGSYPIARWGVERARLQGVAVRSFPAHDVCALEGLIHMARREGRRPVVVVDGLDPASGQVAPVDEYLGWVEPLGGWVVVDDTQALGILGTAPCPAQPFGRGGGGALAWLARRSPSLVLVASLAKGLGVPVAVLAATKEVVEDFRLHAPTRVHCSPPSAAVLSACLRSLELNRREGDRLRRRLAHNILRFREGLLHCGLNASGGLFAVQTPSVGKRATEVHQRLESQGLSSVLHRSRLGAPASLSFLLRADHTVDEIDTAVSMLSLNLNPTAGACRSWSCRHASLA